MGTTAGWHEARKVRERRGGKKRGAKVDGGGSSLEQATVGGVPVVRLSVWPQGASAPPVSYAVVHSAGGHADDDDVDAGEIDQGDFPDDSNGEERRGASAASETNEDFPDDFEQTSFCWRAGDSAFALPLNLQWQQSSQSRWDLFFELPADAACMGLGERMSGLNLRSAIHTLFNTDANVQCETMDLMYQAIPFLIVRHHGQCYGFFLDSPGRQKWDLDSELEGRAHIELLSRRGWQLYCFGPTNLPDLVSAYTMLTGRAKLPPLWSLGHHQCRWSYPDQDTIIRLAHEFRSRQIPCDALWLDIDYMDDYRVFTCSKERFPDCKDLISDLDNNGFKIVTIVDPGVKKETEFFLYDDGKKHDFFCTIGDGSEYVGSVWSGASVFPDFLREDVRLWWAAQHGFHTELGVAGIWCDMNEPAIFDNQRPLADGATELPPDNEQLFMQQVPEGRVGHFEVRNLYGYQMSRATYEGLLALRPGERPFVLTRAGYAGVQRYAAVWLGDNMSWWEHLARSIPMLINLGLSGVGFCGADIGGFNADCSAELMVRWYALGIFYPFLRNHCSMDGAAQETWSFTPEIEEHCRKLIEVRYRLLPYIQQLFVQHARTGAPLIRPLSWHFPDDHFACEIDDQFLFGEDIMVAPILQKGRTTRSVYLPEGKWHKFEGEATYEGERLHQISFGFGEVPAFVRDGAVLPLADPMQTTSELLRSTITFVCYGDSGKCTFYEDDGATFMYQDGAYNEWRIRIDNTRFLAQPVELGFDSRQ
ncbi:MAG TPA: TIM-barrel domain-containing protein, partial [Trichormus sp.]